MKTSYSNSPFYKTRAATKKKDTATATSFVSATTGLGVVTQTSQSTALHVLNKSLSPPTTIIAPIGTMSAKHGISSASLVVSCTEGSKGSSTGSSEPIAAVTEPKPFVTKNKKKGKSTAIPVSSRSSRKGFTVLGKKTVKGSTTPIVKPLPTRTTTTPVPITQPDVDSFVTFNQNNESTQQPFQVEEQQEDSGNEGLTQPIVLERRYLVFLQEPVHLNLELCNDSIELLDGEKGEKCLTTDFIDFLIKQGIPSWKPENVLVPTSNIESLLDMYNAKAKSDLPQDKLFVSQYREKYKHYTTKPFQIYTLSCQKGHFFVMEMVFDATDPDQDYFQYIIVYDSLLRSQRNTELNEKMQNKKTKQHLKNQAALDLLLKYKEFFCHYILYNTENVSSLLNSKDILDDVSYGKSPIQRNSHDCALYAYAIFVHLIRGIRIKENLFTQSQITYFRKSLYIILKASEEELQANPKLYIPEDFITSFFDMTYRRNDKPNYFLNYLHCCTKYVSPTKNTRQLSVTKHNISPSQLSIPSESPLQTDKENNELVEPEQMVQNITPFVDEHFKDIFVYNSEYNNFPDIRDVEDLFHKISFYEIESGIQLRIKKSEPKINSYLYTCMSHKECKFRAKFGPRRGDKKLILKSVHPYHNGIDRFGKYDNGKHFKQRITTNITPNIEKVELVKSSKPVPNDVVKATKEFGGRRHSYDQAHQVMAKSEKNNKKQQKKNYGLLIPYMDEFSNLNPGSVCEYEKHDDGSMSKIFVCPGIMNNKLRFARPVFALDAAHLSTEEKGTLYVAVIKSGNDEVLPIAIGLTGDNENLEGWLFFLKHLKQACPQLTVNHRFEKCHPFKQWTSISDRDKGLIPALKEVFPDNHQTNCLFHIRQNVQTQAGKKASDLVELIGNTFSTRQEQKLLEDLRKINPKIEDYVLRIDPTTWRNTEWIHRTNLPPRYGILTSNMAESINSLFKQERTFDWLRGLDKMLHVISLKISKLRTKHEGKRGMIASYVATYRDLFDKAATYNVIPINTENYTYKVFYGEGSDYNSTKSHVVNMRNRMCTCGQWQNNELMCVHVMSYYRIIERKSVKEILEMPFCQYYSYQYLNLFYKENINPVIIDLLSHDTSTKPPPITEKRASGRPKSARKRKRSKVSVKCSNCEETGHTKKKCQQPLGYAKLMKQLALEKSTADNVITSQHHENSESIVQNTSINQQIVEATDDNFHLVENDDDLEKKPSPAELQEMKRNNEWSDSE
jgi:hypothetical protein